MSQINSQLGKSSDHDDQDVTPVLVVIPDLDGLSGDVLGTLERRKMEMAGLAEAIDLLVLDMVCLTVKTVRPSTLIGKGQLAQLVQTREESDAQLILVDHDLTPVQQRNLEKEIGCKVIDRTGLILEIFGRRAQTKEGVLQVDLAHLNYQKGRLVRSWTHLERQRGGAGFMGGPGETQIEADRRQIQSKIQKLNRELAQVRKTRDLHRKKRKKVPFPVVALVGYTNAGKSTLFNRLTDAKVLAKDMLFATLDPTLRQIALPSGDTAILSDTVGFISQLPTHLVAAFRATLEEVAEADLIVHVRDVSDPAHEAQREDVLQILESLGVEPHNTDRLIEVWNKADLLDNEHASLLENKLGRYDGPEAVLVSAVTGMGVEALLSLVETRLLGNRLDFELTLRTDQMHLLDKIHERCVVNAQTYAEDGSASFSLSAPRAIYVMIMEQLEGSGSG